MCRVGIGRRTNLTKVDDTWRSRDLNFFVSFRECVTPEPRNTSLSLLLLDYLITELPTMTPGVSLRQENNGGSLKLSRLTTSSLKHGYKIDQKQNLKLVSISIEGHWLFQNCKRVWKDVSYSWEYTQCMWKLLDFFNDWGRGEKGDCRECVFVCFPKSHNHLGDWWVDELRNV